MKLSDFCKQPDELSPIEVQSLNRDLSTKVIADIPEENLKDIEEYICDVLLYNAVEHDIQNSLESLLESIRNVRSQTV